MAHLAEGGMEQGLESNSTWQRNSRWEKCCAKLGVECRFFRYWMAPKMGNLEIELEATRDKIVTKARAEEIAWVH